MMWLPKPYPDEAIGSVLARGCRYTGTDWTPMIRRATGMRSAKVSFLMPYSMERLGHLTGMAPRDLLEKHTLFPYLVAFTDPAFHPELRRKALGGAAQRRTLGISSQHVVSHGRARRFCSHCTREDLKTHGESYWRRAHMLPGVQVCARHNSWLFTTSIPIHRGKGTDHLLPTDVTEAPRQIRGRPDALRSFALESQKALLVSPNSPYSPGDYRAAATILGYAGESGLNMVFTKRFAEDLHAFFGRPLLRELRCDWHKTVRTPWPTILLRSTPKVSPPKHILLRAFFKTFSQQTTLRSSKATGVGKL
jgi:hypothetical protein